MKKNVGAWLLTAVVLFSGCNSGEPGSAPSEKAPAGQSAARQSLDKLATQNSQAYSLAFPPNPELLIGPNRLVFALLDKQGAFVPGRKLNMYIARRAQDPAQGPVRVSFEDDGLGDRAFYRASVSFPDTGKWLVLVTETAGGKKLGGGTALEVTNKTDVVRVGEKALPIPTPTFADHLGLADICTSEPEEDPMHEISLDKALDNGKPTLLVFATPKYCSSRVCGPVVDQVLRVRNAGYAGKANFIHVEVFQTDQSGPKTDAMKAYNLQTEPWTFVIDRGGVVRGRFEGPVTTGELKQSLDEVL